jgi:penicillin-binding protein 1A
MAGAARRAWTEVFRPVGADRELEAVVSRLNAAFAEDGLSTPVEPPRPANDALDPRRGWGFGKERARAAGAPRRSLSAAALRFALGLSLGLALATAAFYGAVAPFIDPPVPQRPERMSFLTADGTPLGVTRTGGKGRAEARDAFGTRAEWPPVTLDQLPDHVEDAVLAREDHKFRQHWGVRPESLAAAAAGCLLDQVRRRRCGRGASTLHMQVARGGFRDRPATLIDKAFEIPTALWVARRWSRDEVLERYLNDAYWGQELHGLNAASWRYLRKRPSQLTLPEAALLAGMLSSPNRTDPFADRRRARRERDEVLSAMARHGFITGAQAARARRIPLPERRPQPKAETTQSRAFLRWVAPEALKAAGRAGARDTRITLDTRVQAAAYAAVARRLAGRPDLQAAVVVMRTDGQVLALVGGRTAAEDTGRASEAQRSPASTAKLFTYAEALKHGWRPDDTISGAPVTVGDYTPRNYGGARYGDLYLAEAFALSVNTAAVRLNEELGPKRVAKLAARTGVNVPPSTGAAAPLGAFETTLLQMTSAYAGFVGNCAPVAPTGLAGRPAGNCRPLLSPREHGRLMEMLQIATLPGATGEAAGRAGLRVGGKTGTSAANRDALFIGFLETARGPLMIGVWVGCDQGRPKQEVTGGGLPSLVFSDVAQALARHAA